ncbi:hypothetical protein [Microlunatus endophyticus]|uniref:hypothetical protein n=1 Tax=Microlunatus endophyticus TaxID=1716077 RepID=UPI00166C214D|nr:hypothetical protein [Microlunatus endophyticus]
MEYDGDQHATDAQQRKHDLLRREELDRRDLRMLIFISGDLYKTPSATLERIYRGLVDRGAKGLRPTFREEWRRYFPEQN